MIGTANWYCCKCLRFVDLELTHCDGCGALRGSLRSRAVSPPFAASEQPGVTPGEPFLAPSGGPRQAVEAPDVTTSGCLPFRSGYPLAFGRRSSRRSWR